MRTAPKPTDISEEEAALFYQYEGRRLTKFEYALEAEAKRRYPKDELARKQFKEQFTQWAQIVAEAESVDGKEPVQIIKGGGEGPGRGFFHVEMGDKSRWGEASGHNKTVRKRYENFLARLERAGISTDRFELSEYDKKILYSKDPDFSKLTAEGDWLLFLADKSERPGFSLDALSKGKLQDFENAYIDHHWAGKKGGIDEQKARDNWRNALKRRGISPP